MLRSVEKQFHFKSDRVVCGQMAMSKGKRKVIVVKTIELKDKILAVCHERGDSWVNAV